MANEKKLPIMLYDSSAVDKGGLATYSADYSEIGRLSAKYVQRILEGANAGDFPVEGADKLSLVINLRAARQIGLVIPGPVLARC
jgi:putative ABC transport system substrate-binding protein